MFRPLIPAAIACALFPATLAAQEAELTVVASEEHGPYVADGEGRPVYAFITDLRGGDELPPLESCNKSCVTVWPRVTLDKEAAAPVGDGLAADLSHFVTFENDVVATYGGHPLFYYAEEDKSDAPDGHAQHTFGGWWVLISPDGEIIHDGTIPDPEDAPKPSGG